MSIARIEKLLNTSTSADIPVPRKTISGIKHDPLSKRLRGFDNEEIVVPFVTQAGVYINTNEHGVRQTFSDLKTSAEVPQGMHIGFSGWHNFDIMVERKSSRALICDINPENALFLRYTLKYLIACKSRMEFVDKMTEFVRKYLYDGSRTNLGRESYMGFVCPKSIKFSFNVSNEYPEHFSVKEEVGLELQRETSWLYTDERYAFIRRLALTDKIATITENICAVNVFTAIRHLLIDNSVQVDTVYVSNIAQWMRNAEQKAQFLGAVNALLTDDSTLLIAAQTDVDSPDRSLVQRCASRKEVHQKLSLEEWFFSRVSPTMNKEVTLDEVERLFVLSKI